MTENMKKLCEIGKELDSLISDVDRDLKSMALETCYSEQKVEELENQNENLRWQLVKICRFVDFLINIGEVKGTSVPLLQSYIEESAKIADFKI